MSQRLINLSAVVLLFATAMIGSPQTAQIAIDWQGLETAWNAYYAAPNEAAAEKVLSLLPGNAKITDIKDSLILINSIHDHLGILEGEIYSNKPNAIKLGFRLYAISYGTFEATLNKIIGNLIAFSPRLFLEELMAHRNLIPSLNPILGSFLKDFPDDATARVQEKKLRINVLTEVEDKELQSIRNECIKILKKLSTEAVKVR